MDYPNLAHFVTKKSIETIQTAVHTLDTRRTSARDIVEVWRYATDIVKKIKECRGMESIATEDQEFVVEPALSVSCKGKTETVQRASHIVTGDRWVSCLP